MPSTLYRLKFGPDYTIYRMHLRYPNHVNHVIRPRTKRRFWFY